MDTDNWQSFFASIVNCHSCSASNCSVVIINGQQCICMVYHVVIPLSVSFRSRLLPYHNYLRVRLYETASFLMPVIPVFIMAPKWKRNDQLDIGIFRLLLHSEQDLRSPHIYSHGAAHIKAAEALFIKQNELVMQSLFQPLAAIVILSIFPLEPGRAMSCDCTGQHSKPPFPQIGNEKTQLHF